MRIPDIIIRRFLHGRGFRYRLHDKKLPGKPDIVLPKYHAVIHINGCFWHGHGCYLFKWPKSRQKFWKEKILANKARDERNLNTLKQTEWRVLVIWECALKGRGAISLDTLGNKIEAFLKSSSEFMELEGSLQGKQKESDPPSKAH